MTYAYWQQWDKSDLDSWQGKDYPCEEEEVDVDYDEPEEECLCCCSRNPCGNCMDCLGLSWRDFM
jgi:hypothetical protein